MARVTFLTDEHISKAVAQGLRARGVDAVTAAEAGTLGATDQGLLDLLKNQGRTVITADPDFLRLHAAPIGHAGIVFVRQGMPIGDVIRGALVIAEVLDSMAMANHVEFL
jgi:predicted nuclease of predicted toxin-antitoxin system